VALNLRFPTLLNAVLHRPQIISLGPRTVGGASCSRLAADGVHEQRDSSGGAGIQGSVSWGTLLIDGGVAACRMAEIDMVGCCLLGDGFELLRLQNGR
jgi:hypothetical protein